MGRYEHNFPLEPDERKAFERDRVTCHSLGVILFLVAMATATGSKAVARS